MTFDFDRIIERRNTDSLKWTTYRPDVLPLWVADMDFQTPEPIRDALRGVLDHGVLGYEALVRRTQNVIAARMEKLYGWKVDPDWIVATVGVVNGFTAAARALCNPSDGVLIQTPVYHMFYSVYKNLGLTQQTAPFQCVSEGQHIKACFDPTVFAQALHSERARTRMFLLCHPHNPLGRVFSRQELTAMAQMCLENEVVIVSDEIHCELLLSNEPHVPIATLSPEIADATITLVSGSKAFNTCGLFCGFAIIPNAQLRKRFGVALEQLSGHTSSLGLVAAEVAFSGACDDWLQAVRTYLRDTRDFVVRRLAEVAPRARFVVPDATYLQWIDLGEYVRSGTIAGSPQQYLLEKAKVALNDGKTFGVGYEDYVRLNFAAPRSIVAQALEQIGAVLG